MSSFAISDHWSRGWALLASVGLDTRILFLLFVHLLEEQHTSWQLASSVFSSVKVLKYIKLNEMLKCVGLSCLECPQIL